MKLQYIPVPVPVWSPPDAGPWTLQWTRSDGSTFRGDDHEPCQVWDLYADADYWRALAEQNDPEGCRVDVVPAAKTDR